MADALPPAYSTDAYRTDLETIVTATGVDARGHWVECADTVLFPEGGGQPADHGTVGGRPVVDVQKVDGAVRHYVAPETAHPAPGDAVQVTVDWVRRFDHMQQHSAQHLLTAVAADRFGLRTTAFHLGHAVSDIELDVAALSAAERTALEEAAAAEVRAARPIRASLATPAELEAQTVRSRGLPGGHVGPVRLVTIDGLDVATCGGTHVASTAEIEAIGLLGVERMRGGVRLQWVAGRRVRQRLAADEARFAALRRRLGAPDDGLEAALEARLARLAQAERRVTALEDELARSLAQSIAAGIVGAAPDGVTGVVLCAAHCEGLTAAQLLVAANAVRSELPAALVVLGGGGAPNGHLVIAADPAIGDARLARVGGAVAAWLGGRGGGRGGVFKGAVASPERLAVADDRPALERCLRSAWSESSAVGA